MEEKKVCYLNGLWFILGVRIPGNGVTFGPKHHRQMVRESVTDRLSKIYLSICHLDLYDFSLQTFSFIFGIVSLVINYDCCMSYHK